MTNNEQQTAVDSVIEYFSQYVDMKKHIEEIQQFKEMEKEQILDAYECGFESEHDARIPQSSMRYYKQTYGGDNK
jgi:NADH:ubiquinone oxidoreductase subunit 3 (subunit A)